MLPAPARRRRRSRTPAVQIRRPVDSGGFTAQLANTSQGSFALCVIRATNSPEQAWQWLVCRHGMQCPSSCARQCQGWQRHTQSSALYIASGDAFSGVKLWEPGDRGLMVGSPIVELHCHSTSSKTCTMALPDPGCKQLTVELSD